MPLLERTRVEVYLPDVPKPAYQDLLHSLEREFTHAFGGSTVIRRLDGSYLSKFGQRLKDAINLIYTDMPFALEKNLRMISRYTDELRDAAFHALAEEAILVVAFPVHHAEGWLPGG